MTRYVLSVPWVASPPSIPVIPTGVEESLTASGVSAPEAEGCKRFLHCGRNDRMRHRGRATHAVFACTQPIAENKLRLMNRRAAIAFAALSSLLLALVLTAMPAVHEHLHSDAGHPQHECAIAVVETAIESGDAPLAFAAPQGVTLFSTPAALHPVWVPALFQRARVFEHAPPAFS